MCGKFHTPGNGVCLGSYLEKIYILGRQVGFLALCQSHTSPLPRKKLGYDFLKSKFITNRQTDKCVWIFSSSKFATFLLASLTGGLLKYLAVNLYSKYLDLARQYLKKGLPIHFWVHLTLHTQQILSNWTCYPKSNPIE